MDDLATPSELGSLDSLLIPSNSDGCLDNNSTSNGLLEDSASFILLPPVPDNQLTNENAKINEKAGGSMSGTMRWLHRRCITAEAV
jgi:hypothetical protein